MKPSLNQEFKYTIGKLIIPPFDHSSQMSTNPWIQLSVYFQLNLMVEEVALKISILHIEAEANHWWFHALRSFRHYWIHLMRFSPMPS